VRGGQRLKYIANDTCKKVVGFGSNFASTIGLPLTFELRNRFILSSYLESTLTGLLLGDGHLAKSNKKHNARFRKVQSLEKFSYIWY